MHTPKILLTCSTLLTLVLCSSCEARRGADDALEGGHRSPGQHASTTYRNPYHGNAQAITAGKELFASNCAGCHGRDATGKRGPDLTRQSLKYGSSDENLRVSIANGRPGGMPAFVDRLDQDSIAKISAFIRSIATGK